MGLKRFTWLSHQVEPSSSNFESLGTKLIHIKGGGVRGGVEKRHVEGKGPVGTNDIPDLEGVKLEATEDTLRGNGL